MYPWGNNYNTTLTNSGETNIKNQQNIGYTLWQANL